MGMANEQLDTTSSPQYQDDYSCILPCGMDIHWQSSSAAYITIQAREESLLTMNTYVFCRGSRILKMLLMNLQSLATTSSNWLPDGER